MSDANTSESTPESGDADEERRLVLRSQAGDRHAYGLLVQRYMQRAYFVALGFIGSHQEALDMSQEAFVRAYRAIKRFDPERRFFTWYYQILRNLCLNARRDRARRSRRFSEIGETRIQQWPDGQADAQETLERAELREAVWKALDALEEQQREVIILKDFENLAYKDIAELLGCPIGTVMSRLYYARKALKTHLEAYFHDA